MKIGVISDTHGHLVEMRRAAKILADDYEVDVIVHLGDEMSDADELRALPVDIFAVPGIFEDSYKDEAVANRIIVEFEDVPFLISHTPTKDDHDLPEDIDPTIAIEDGDVKVLLHGHSHLWRIEEDKGVIVINPGHLNPGDKRGREMTFSLIDIEEEKLTAKIFSLSGNIIAEKRFFIDF